MGQTFGWEVGFWDEGARYKDYEGRPGERGLLRRRLH